MARVFDADARELLEQPALVTAIDVPIGLPSSTQRQVDRLARLVLGPLKSSVFPAPVRATLRAPSYEAASAVSHLACGSMLSKQTFANLPRIRDVDAALRESSRLLESVHEVHPEVSFVYWNDRRPLRHPKVSGFGFLERLQMVEAFYDSSVDEVRRSVPRRKAADDDILDAFAALWTAQRIYDGRAVRINPTDERDEHGLPMQMWA